MNLMDAIHAMSKPQSDDNDSGDGSSPHIPEELCLLLTKNAQRVSELSQEVELMKLQLLYKMKGDDVPNSDFYYDNDDEEFDDIDLSDTDKDNLSTSTTSTSSFSISERSQKDIDLEEEIDRVNSKCESLQRSMKALKRKNTEREYRAMKSLKNMRKQIDVLEEERRRRVEMQTSAEERATKLQNELDQLKQKMNEETQSELLSDSNTEEEISGETNPLTSKAVEHCRDVVMLRNKQNQNLVCPPLVAVRENSELSGISEDECIPRLSGHELRDSWLTQGSMELPVM